MNHNNQHEDQAYQLRNEIQGVNHESNDVNVLELPPRSQVHDKKKKKSKLKWRISYPLVRLLVVLFILIVALVLTIHIWGDELFNYPIINKPNNNHPAGEIVNILSD